MIVDGHAHIHPDIHGFGSRCDASLETLAEAIRTSPVDKVVLLAIAPDISNEFIADACRQYPDELIGFASVDPLGGEAAVAELRSAIDTLGLRGLKLHPRRQGFGIEEVAAVVPLAETAAALGIPVLLDAFPYGRELFDVREVELILQLASAVPKATIIMAHAGGLRVLDAVLVAKACPNVMLDISFTPHYYAGSSVMQDLVYAINKVGAGRIIYGSDYPDIPLNVALEEAKTLLGQCDLSASDMDQILGGNIMRLLT